MRKKHSAIFITAFELGIAAGIILAFYIVPASTRATTFWTIAAALFLIANGFVFVGSRSISK